MNHSALSPANLAQANEQHHETPVVEDTGLQTQQGPACVTSTNAPPASPPLSATPQAVPVRDAPIGAVAAAPLPEGGESADADCGTPPTANWAIGAEHQSAPPVPANHAEVWPADPPGWRPVTKERVDADRRKFHLIKGVIRQQDIGSIYGASNAGKTAAVIDMCVHIAAGLDWAGRQTMKAPIIYFGLESGVAIAARVEARSASLGLGAEVASRVRVFDHYVGLLDDQDVASIIDYASQYRPKGLIVIDTLSVAIAGADENASSTMSSVTKNAAEIAKRTGFSVLLVHHTGKNPKSSERGSGALRGNCDFMLKVEDGKCRRRSNIDPPCRSNTDPGMDAGRARANCG
jgi:hypothetical protein